MKVLISTSNFCEFSNSPIEILLRNKFHVIKNPYGRKMTSDEIIDLAEMLNSMGARIEGAGSDKIVIEGVESLTKTVFEIPADRIEAGTYLAAATVTKGDVTIEGINPNRLMKVIEKLKNTGANINCKREYK